MTRRANRFYLVQRLSPRTYGTGKGFDTHFKMEYMGSSEFEWGALPDSLKAMRATDLQITGLPLDAVTVYFVAAKTNTTLHDDFMDWATNPKRPFWSKDATYLDELIEGARREYVDTIGWWDVDSHVMFALDRDTAEKMLAGVVGGKGA